MRASTACLIALSLVIPVGSAFAHGGSAEDQIACTPDVYRLCSQFIPDEDTIVACLQRRKAELSAACHEVFSRPDPKPKSGDDNDDSDN